MVLDLVSERKKLKKKKAAAEDGEDEHSTEGEGGGMAGGGGGGVAGGGAGAGEMDDDQLVAAAKEKRLRLKKLKVSPAFIDKNQWLALKKLSNDASLSRIVVCTETPLIPLSTHPVPSTYRAPEALAKGHIIRFAPIEVSIHPDHRRLNQYLSIPLSVDDSINNYRSLR